MDTRALVGDLPAGAILNPGDTVTSSDGRFQLKFDAGALSLTQLAAPSGVLWATPSVNGTQALMEYNGMLQIYGADGAPAWSTLTTSPNAHLVVQNDGNAVLYATDGTPVWATNTRARAGDGVAGLPQGLTGCIAYYTGVVEPCDQTQFDMTFFSDGDWGKEYGEGFGHSEVAHGLDASSSDRLVLPAGTTCGFHHTRNTPNRTCMGFDPAMGCPNGWVQRQTFDMSSGNAHWVWCEYADPNGLCANGSCMGNLPLGATCGMASNTGSGDTGSAGSCLGVSGNSACPGGLQGHDHYDDGRPSGVGVTWCSVFETTRAYQGCYVDMPQRALPVAVAENASIEDCISIARTWGFKYAGLQYGSQCFAGDTLGYERAPESECNMRCGANSRETCGGTWRNSVYATGL